jgi:hypothetical protein
MGRAYGDGRVPYYPRVAAGQGTPRLVVEAELGGISGRASWDGAGDLDLPLDVAAPAGPVQLDVVFLIDTTGSMSDEIAQIKATLLAVSARLREGQVRFDLRYGAVVYRDLGDEYVTRAHPFTRDLAAFDTALRAVNAGGGGDQPESVNQGLAEAIGRMEWREGSAKVVFLIGDAPPHMDYQEDVRYGRTLVAAVARGVRVHAVAASGLPPLGTVIWRQIAQFSRGKFIFIEYGSPASSAASHGVAGEVKSNNLDDIIYEQIRAELDGWGKM